MLTYDPTISTGNLLTAGSILLMGLGVLIRQSFNAGAYSKDFDALRGALADIKTALKDQDTAFRAKNAADSLADGLMLVLQQRVLTLEQKSIRYEEQILTLQLKLAAEPAV